MRCTQLNLAIQYKSFAINPTFMKLIMFTFCWQCVREALIQLHCQLWGWALKGANILSTEHCKPHKVRVYCRAVVLDCGGFCKVYIPNKLTPQCIVKYLSVSWRTACLLWLEMLRVLKTSACLSGSNMVDKANKIYSCNSHKQLESTIHSATPHQKHLCCSVNAAWEKEEFSRMCQKWGISVLRLKWKELCVSPNNIDFTLWV